MAALAFEALTSADVARADLICFTLALFPGYRPARHHYVIADHLMAVERGDIDRLLITVPPRHGKSELASVNFPAWYLGRNPDKAVLACSATAALADDFSRLARNKLLDPDWPFATGLADDLANVRSWAIGGRRGKYTAAGVGGQIVGKGADVLIIDDPVKSAEDAASQTARDRVWQWYTGTAYHRLQRGGAVILIMTRWHTDDLAGRLLAEQARGGDQWTVVDLPALAEPADALGRRPGAALWPEEYPADALARIRKTIGEYWFLALYQGRPVPGLGVLLNPAWFGTIPPPPHNYRALIQMWDTAAKPGDGHDYSVGLTLGVAPDGYDVLDVWRDRADYPALRAAVRDQYTLWHQRYPAIPVTVLIEEANSGPALIQELGRTTRLPIVPVHDGRTNAKVLRALDVMPLLEARRVRLPADAHWRDAFVAEIGAFDRGEHDDQVDALTYALRRAAGLDRARGGVAVTSYIDGPGDGPRGERWV